MRLIVFFFQESASVVVAVTGAVKPVLPQMGNMRQSWQEGGNFQGINAIFLSSGWVFVSICDEMEFYVWKSRYVASSTCERFIGNVSKYTHVPITKTGPSLPYIYRIDVEENIKGV